MFNVTTEFTESTELKIYNLKGQKIRQYLIFSDQTSIIWNGKDQTGKSISSGIYFYQLVIDGKIVAKNKMILLK